MQQQGSRLFAPQALDPQLNSHALMQPWCLIKRGLVLLLTLTHYIPMRGNKLPCMGCTLHA